MEQVLSYLVSNDAFLTAVGAGAVFVALVVLGFIGRAVMRNERITAYAGAIKMARDYAKDLMLTIRTEGLDMNEVSVDGKIINYNDLSEASVDKYGYKVDARMLYVLDSVERAVYKRFGLRFEADEIIPRAEAWYQQLRREPNGITMNDNDVVTGANGQAAHLEVTVSPARSEAQRLRRERETKERQEQAEREYVAQRKAKEELMRSEQRAVTTKADTQLS